jgi:WD40 repeat protein
LFSINIKNGAKMKKFRKSKKKKGSQKDKDDISSLYYWGDKNILISSSWDGRVRLYDDSTADQEGTKRYTMKKHEDSVNFIDFKESNPDDPQDPPLCASCSDDGSVVIYNYGSYR